MLHTLLFNRSDRVRFQFTGPKAVETINGLVTNDVARLTAGQGLYAGVLTAKSKILADTRVFLQDEGVILLDTTAAAGPGLRDFFKKYVNPRLSKMADVSESSSCLSIFGNQAREIVAATTRIDSNALEALTPYSHMRGAFNGADVTVVRTPELSVEGYDLLVNPDQEEAVSKALVDAGAVLGSPELWRELRIEIGWPEWGVDMDDSTLPQEANFDELNAISYNKGCYIGQETVARIHFRGHVNKMLRRLSFAGSDLPPRDAEVFDLEGKSVGKVSSSVELSDGRKVGLGMVRREVTDGTILSTRWDGESSETQLLGNAKGVVN